jgi:hypothetical protein
MTIFGKHIKCLWKRKDSTYGMHRRGVTGYRQCQECGRTQIRKSWHGWVDNGENIRRERGAVN